ncbi:MAG: hypothetical protein U0R26_08655 [Solirubrobacterales bacterium]
MKVNSPLGELPYRFEGLGLRDGSLVVRGRVSEWDSQLVLEPGDLAVIARALALSAVALAGAAVAFLAIRRRARRGA